MGRFIRRLAALDFDEQLIDDISENELQALEAIWQVGHPDVFSELFDHLMQQTDIALSPPVFAHDVIRQLTSHVDRFRRGLLKLGQTTLVKYFDDGISLRPPGNVKEMAAAFNVKVRQHFYGCLAKVDKYSNGE